MPPDHVLVQGDTEAGLVRNRDSSLIDDRLIDAFHQIAPPGDIQRMVLASEEIGGGGGANSRSGLEAQPAHGVILSIRLVQNTGQVNQFGEEVL